MYKPSSLTLLLRQSLNNLRRDKRYKKYKIKLNRHIDNLVKVIYKHYYDLVVTKIKYINIYKSFDKYCIRRYHFYDVVITKMFKDFIKFFVNKTGKSKSIYDIINGYLIVIFCYGLLVNIGLGVFDVELSFKNVVISGVWFYFIKEELLSYILLLVRGVRQ